MAHWKKWVGICNRNGLEPDCKNTTSKQRWLRSIQPGWNGTGMNSASQKRLFWKNKEVLYVRWSPASVWETNWAVANRTTKVTISKTNTRRNPNLNPKFCRQVVQIFVPSITSPRWLHIYKIVTESHKTQQTWLHDTDPLTVTTMMAQTHKPSRDGWNNG